MRRVARLRCAFGVYSVDVSIDQRNAISSAAQRAVALLLLGAPFQFDERIDRGPRRTDDPARAPT